MNHYMDPLRNDPCMFVPQTKHTGYITTLTLNYYWIERTVDAAFAAA